MKSILVPTDFSDCAKNATLAALALASKLNAEIHFLHIMEDPSVAHVPHSKDISIKDMQEVHARAELSLLVTLASKAGLTATPVLVFDKGNEKIENYIRPLKIDLIVMGSHGAKGIRELVIGSNAQRLIRHSPVPVLVVKKLTDDSFKMESIVFASTFKEDVTQPLAQVVNLARLFKARVHMLFLNFIDKVSDQQAIDSIVLDFSELYPDVDFTSSTAESNDEEWGIHGFIEMIDADMVAITTAAKSGFLVRHSLAEDLVNHEKIPVLVLGNPSR
jgi:nucleotide-binding universal stress UspA family protein